jgi:hypothetical protein
MGSIEMALKWENAVGAFLDSDQCFFWGEVEFFNTFFQVEKYDFDTQKYFL